MGKMAYVETPDLEVSFTCTVRGGPSSGVVILWDGPAAGTLPDPTTVEIRDGVFMSNLTLTNVTTAFTGLYYCTAVYNNSLCNASVTSNASLIVTGLTGEPAIINKTWSPINVSSGTNISLYFEFSALRPSHTAVQCSGPDGAIETNVGITLARTDIACQIRLDVSIVSVNYTRVGQYSCTANNSAGDITATILLLVRPVVEPREVLAKNGDNLNITLMCLAQSFPEPSYIWEKLRDSSDNDTVPGVFGFVSGSGENRMATHPFLDFKPVGYGDAGVYRCVVNISETWMVSSNQVLLAGKVQK